MASRGRNRHGAKRMRAPASSSAPARAGLMAADGWRARGGASSSMTRARARRASSCSPGAAASTSPIPSRSRRSSRATGARGRAAASGDRSLPAAGFARLGGGTRRRDLRRLERAGVPEELQGDAAPARLARAARRPRRRAAAAIRFLGFDEDGALEFRRALRRGARAGRGLRYSRSAAPPGRGLGADGGWVERSAPPESRSRR